MKYVGPQGRARRGLEEVHGGPPLQGHEDAFDGKRLIYGGFEVLFSE